MDKVCTGMCKYDTSLSIVAGHCKAWGSLSVLLNTVLHVTTVYLHYTQWHMSELVNKSLTIHFIQDSTRIVISENIQTKQTYYNKYTL